MLGEQLGSGMSRQVCIHPTDKNKVIKIENSKSHFQNVIEWEMWQRYKNTQKVARWLAPCYAISHSGTFLVMERVKDIEKPPHQLPTFLNDHKLTNFGKMPDGRIVARDYGLLTLDPDLKLRKWFGHNLVRN